MFEGTPETPEINVREILKRREASIDNLLELLAASGLTLQKWNDEYESLPYEIEAFDKFYEKLQDFNDRREDALTTFEFPSDISPETCEQIRQFDRDVMRAFQYKENRLGNGATAEVYSMNDNDAVCIKFITNQENYDKNNHIRVEYERLKQAYEATRGEAVGLPHPMFLRIHVREGHSYGMEKINGASLSQLDENPEKYPEVIAVAKKVDRKKMKADLVIFLNRMHEGGVTHGDLYMRNLMIDLTGRLYVIDFGKAKVMDFKGDREEARKSDLYLAEAELEKFFSKLDKLN